MPDKRSRQRDFNRLVARGVTLVDFDATWSQPCREQASIVVAIGQVYKETVRVRILPIDENREVALNLGIHSIPTILIYLDGKEVDRFVGRQSSQTLGRALGAIVGPAH